ncbi:hypothetical protein MG293_020863 [Ovis ammon polii]|uniref:HSF-type DNA-binding domain-containing protein n=1 Tax=Ovis ammon polii TaxID=230172 RepID=A0AAD4TN16_OVIAM|nr:hypothetical protein MG293_020863 [Ovis ammon polii]
MAHISSEIQDGPPKGESTGSETSIRSYWYDYTTGDSVLRSMIEEYAFQALAEDLVIKRPHYTYSVSETDDVNDFLLLTFPQKLWNIVESDQFESIWWDETGTCRVINEELFRKEVLERKEPFRKFETKSMKRLIRQLNLYGVNKNRQTVQRSAALPVFLEEENNISLLRKVVKKVHMDAGSLPIPRMEPEAIKIPYNAIRDSAPARLPESSFRYLEPQSGVITGHPFLVPILGRVNAEMRRQTTFSLVAS